MRRLIVLAVACAVPTALFAQAASEPTTPAAPTAAAVVTPEEKPSCRAYQRTGSIMPGKRICHTKAEWRIIDSQMAEAARRQLGRDRAMGSSAPN